MIEWGKEALSDLRKLPRNLRERIFYSVERFDASGIGDVKKLKGFEAYRLRVGKYRVIFKMKGDIIFVVRVLKREDAYDDLT